MKLLFSKLYLPSLLLCLIISKSDAFQEVSFHNNRGTSSLLLKTSPPLLKATIFAPDGDYSWIEEDDNIYQNEQSSKISHQLSRSDRVASLARLAAAFPPNGHALEISHIESVSVIGVDETHIDIQAVICEEDGCVTVKVPIEFPSPCQTMDDEECILHQFHELDYKAMEQLKQQQQEQQQKQKELEQQRLTQDFMNNIDYPTWWQQPTYNNLLNDCNQILSLLNLPDFRREIHILAEQSLAMHHSSNDDWEVEHASIIAVNPAGIYLRIKATKYSHSYSDQIFDMRTELIDIPLSFGTVAHTAEELRTAVLRMVEGNSVFM